MTDLSIAINRQMLAAKISQAIDDYCVKTYSEPFRKHLGASVIGDECSRKLYYMFRWFKAVQKSPREYRLFNRGNLEELRFVDYLRGIGMQVWVKDDNNRQFVISDIGNHFGGSTDGVSRLPDTYNILEPLLCEFKTKGTGSGFDKLKKNGIKVEAHQHFVQMSVYGFKLNIKYGLYMVANKNDDELYIEIVELDHRLALSSIGKAAEIINAKQIPTRISENAATIECRMCDFSGICHRNERASINCRSCKFSVPLDAAEWGCNLNGRIEVINKQLIPVGCQQYEAIK